MEVFCVYFFRKAFGQHGSILDILCEVEHLENNLKKYAFLYSKNGEDGYLIRYQGLRDDRMIRKFESATNEFVSLLKIAIWRPVKKRNTCSTYPFWCVPMRIPGVHDFVSHISDFVLLRCLGKGGRGEI